MTYLKLVAILAFIVWLAAPLQARDAAVGGIAPAEAAELIKNDPDSVLILDVRTPSEYKTGHLANARNMDFFGTKFEQEILALPKDKTILLYCRSGKRSASAAEMLEKAGLKKVLDLSGGLTEWEKAGLPLEKPEE